MGIRFPLLLFVLTALLSCVACNGYNSQDVILPDLDGSGTGARDGDGDGRDEQPGGPPPYPGRGVLFTDELYGGEQYWIEPDMVFVSVSAGAYAWSDPNWFDHERTQAEYDEYYDWAYGGYRSEPAFLNFLAAERAEVDEWWDIKGAELRIPAGQSLEQIVREWPAQYPIIESVQPMRIE